MNYILAHDFGTSANKATLFTTDGEFVKTKTVSYPTYYSNGTWAEQDPEDWWKAFCQSTKTLLEGIDATKVLCVAFDGTYPNCLCVDKDLKPMHRAMIWQDSRSFAQAKAISALLPAKYLVGRPNNLMPTDRTLAKLLWVKENQPEIFKNTYKVFPSVMDYIILKMTGNAVCDLETASGSFMLNVEKTDWSDEVLEIAGVPRHILPELHKRTDIVGEVPEGFEEACGLMKGTKLVMGTGDSPCMSIGAGVLNPGDCYLNGGTSAGVIGVGRDGKKIGGNTSSSGSSFSWLKNTFCLAEQQLAAQTGRDVYDIMGEEIAKAPVGSNGVMFHPYLAGERAPRNNPRAKGSFVGITLTTSRQDIMRSVIEGIGFNINVILQKLRDDGYEITRIPFVGGLGKGEVTRQIFSDIMNLEFITYEYMDEAATAGVAVLGGIAIGLYEDESACKKFMRPVGITKPNLENHEQYKKLMPLFEAVYESQLPIYEQL